MRIHRVALSHFRGVESCHVHFAVDGVTVIEGPNEVGKTSIAEAIDLVLTEADSAKNRRVKAIVPVGLDEAPEVEIELSTGDYHFVLRKRWYRKPQTTLHITSPSHEQLGGREAHDRMRAILAETVDDGLLAALRVEQAVGPAQAHFDTPSLGVALDRCAGGELAGDREDGLWDRIQDEYLRYWTANGQPRADRKDAAAEVEAAHAEVGRLEGALGELEADAEEVGRLGVAIEQAERQLSERARTLDDLVERWRRVEQRRDQIARLESDLGAATSREQLAASELSRRSALIEQLQTARDALEAVEAERQGSDALVGAAQDEVDRARGSVEVARAALQNAERRSLVARADESLHTATEDLVELEQRRLNVVSAQRKLFEAQATLDEVPVDDHLLERIQSARLELVRAEAAATAGAPTVTATALSPTRLDVDGQVEQLTVGDAVEHRVTDSLELHVPEVMTVRIVAGNEAAELARRVQHARESLRRLCVEGGVEDPDAAQQSHARRSRAVAARSAALSVIDSELKEPTLDALEERIERLTKHIAELRSSRRVDDGELPIDLESARAARSSAEAAEAAARAELDRVESTTRAAADHLNELLVSGATLAERARNASATVTTAAATLESARVEQPDDELERILRESSAASAALRTSLDDSRRALRAEDPDALSALLDNARDVVERTRSDLDSHGERRKELLTELRVRGEQGLHQQLDQAATLHDHLAAVHDRTEARAAAARLLHDTFRTRRSEARKRYVAPFRDRIESLGRIVFGQDLQVDLDENLCIDRRTLDGTTLAFDQLSIGAREQLALISRLACAAIVSPDGGAPVIFDDALGWTDPTRLDSMGAAIAIAGRDCQVIVLTCTPDRYATVGNAKVVRLPRTV